MELIVIHDIFPHICYFERQKELHIAALHQSTMCDPLSIAAGMVGIVSAAARISSLSFKFTKATKDAPQQAQVIVTEVNDISGILSQLQSFLLGHEFSDRSRSSLLKVDQVVAIVSSCVLTFLELEKLLDELEVDNLDAIDRIEWARKETIMAKLIQRIQNHKASLSLMLNILNGLVLVSSPIDIKTNSIKAYDRRGKRFRRPTLCSRRIVLPRNVLQDAGPRAS